MPVARQHAVEVSVIIFDFSWERESEGETERSKWRREQECVSECMGEPLRRKTFPALISCSHRCGCSEYVVTVTIGTILVVCLFKMVLNHVIYCNAVRYCVLNKAAKVKFFFKKSAF